MSKLLIGRTFPERFGYLPSPPEPETDKWYESHCYRCKHNREWCESGKFFSECANGTCEFEEMEDDTYDNR